MTIQNLDWLPSMVSVNGKWEETLAMLYSIFDKDFKQANRKFQGLPIWWNRRVLEGIYEEGFWHLITKDNSGKRLFDPRRAERLPWCGPIIDHAHNCTSITTWSYREGNGKCRIYIWLKERDYVIILENKKTRIGEVIFLVTAFYVEGESTKRKLEKKYANREI